MSKKIRSTSRLSRCATASNTPRASGSSHADQPVHRPVAGVVGHPVVAAGQAGQVHVVGDPRGRGQLRGRGQGPVGDQREQHPLHHRIPPGAGRPDRRSRVSIPSRCHSRSSSHAPPSGRDSANASPGSPTGRARSGPGRRRRVRAHHPGQRGDQPLDRGPVELVGAAEGVQHLRRAWSSPPDPTRCGPTAGTTPASRPGCAGSTYARTRHQTLHGLPQLTAAGMGKSCY